MEKFYGNGERRYEKQKPIIEMPPELVRRQKKWKMGGSTYQSRNSNFMQQMIFSDKNQRDTR